MRLFELHAKQAVTEQEAEEYQTLLFKVRLAIAERDEGPMAAATVAAEELAFEEASNEAEQAGLSPFGVHLAAVTAEAVVRGHSPSEAGAEEYLTDTFWGARSGDGRGRLSTQDSLEAIHEVKKAGLWPWKGVN